MWLKHEFPYRKHFDRNKCIFIHIPKAAGTSVLAALGKKSEKGRDHVSWQTYKKADSKKFNNYFKFSFVRNPYDRAFSAYHYILKGGESRGLRTVAWQPHSQSIVALMTLWKPGSGKVLFRSHLLFHSQSSFIMSADRQVDGGFPGTFRDAGSGLQDCR